MTGVFSSLGIIFLVITDVLSILLVVLVYRDNPKSATNKTFSLLGLLIVAWLTVNFISLHILSSESTLFIVRLGIFLAMPMNTVLLIFSHTFPSTELRLKRGHLLFLIIATIATMILNVSPYAFTSIGLRDGVPSPIPGLGLLPFGIFSISFNALAVYVLYRRQRYVVSSERQQIRLIMLGIFFMFGLIISTIFIPIVFFKINMFVPLMPFYTLIFLGITTYAILRHHLFNLKTIASEILVFIIWIVLFAKVFVAQTSTEKIVDFFIFSVTIPFGILLIRSVLKEVQQRERLEVLTRELDRANEVLAQTNVKLAKMDELKSEFVSMAGHQLRAPMTVIKGYISMILDGTIKGANAGIKNGLGKAMFSTEQLIKLVASLLDLSRIESGKIKYEMVEGDLAKIAGEVIDGFKAGAEKKNVALAFGNHAAAPVKFAFDQDKIREAVVNYMDNAIKYSSAGGRVVVGLDVTGSGADAWARLSVKDNGLGIKHEDIAKLFDKFSRTDEAKNFDPNGMGIGLYFAKRVVQDHGGRVWAESEGIGRGSTFSLELPLVPRPPHEME